jgi:hypothetical protein
MVRKLALAVLLLSIPAGAAASVSLELDNGAFKVIGWTAGSEPPGGWESVLSVFVGQQSADTPPVFGSYSVEKGVLTFRPRFPLSPGVSYQAVFHPPAGGPAVQADLKAASAPASASPRTHVSGVYPSSNVLPENQLKMYVYFSAPMQRGDVWPKIHLTDEAGKPAYLPFVELEQELWDRSQQRLTMLFDPGRIKRGVKPNVDMGPVLEAGKRYTLVIDVDLKDAHGAPLEAPFRKEFTAGLPERRGIDPKQWKITEPKQGTTDPLAVDFGRPLDYALLQDVFEVTGVKGTAAISRDETEWRFTPSRPWTAGAHALVVDMALEDLAGNRIGRPFDVDTFTSPAPRISNQTTTVPFKVR